MLSELNGLIAKQLGKYVSAEFLDALKTGHLRLSEAFVVPYVRGALAGESQVQVGAVALGEEGLQVELLCAQYGAEFVVPITARVQGLELERARQCVTVEVRTGTPAAQAKELSLVGLYSKLAAALATGMIQGVVQDRIAKTPLVRTLEQDNARLLVEVDLSTLPAVQKLATPLPLVNRCVLDFITVSTVTHVPGAIMVEVGPRAAHGIHNRVGAAEGVG